MQGELKGPDETEYADRSAKGEENRGEDFVTVWRSSQSANSSQRRISCSLHLLVAFPPHGCDACPCATAVKQAIIAEAEVGICKQCGGTATVTDFQAEGRISPGTELWAGNERLLTHVSGITPALETASSLKSRFCPQVIEPHRLFADFPLTR